MVLVNKETNDFLSYYITKHHGKTTILSRITVEENKQQKGYGTKMLKNIIKNSEQANRQEIKTFVDESNEICLNFLEKNEFKVIEERNIFIVSNDKLPSEPEGTLRHLEWGEIQLMSLRLGLNPITLELYFGREFEHLLLYLINNTPRGFCILNEQTKNISSLILKDPKKILDFIATIKQRFSSILKDKIKFGIDGQKELVTKCFDENCEHSERYLILLRKLS
ncbi:MAG: GNAT family N-acetyltransferase [Asgard group archaeon]|nr:GNAT family N-acetyltransferase [Asgard group archaeon]